MTNIVKELPKEEISKFRTFQHLYAGANTIMPNKKDEPPGKKLVFGGPAGGVGTYTTKDEAEIAYLEELSQTSGTMISEIKQDPEGRTIVRVDESIKADIQEAVADSRKNTAAETNPAIVAARENLAQNIAKN